MKNLKAITRRNKKQLPDAVKSEYLNNLKAIT